MDDCGVGGPVPGGHREHRGEDVGRATVGAGQLSPRTAAEARFPEKVGQRVSKRVVASIDAEGFAAQGMVTEGNLSASA